MIKNPKFLSQHPKSASGRWPGRDRHLPDKQNLCHGRRENQSIKHRAGVKPAQIGARGERQLQMGISPFSEKALKAPKSRCQGWGGVEQLPGLIPVDAGNGGGKSTDPVGLSGAKESRLCTGV